jgi:transcriptional regulator with XRE-family HTH domain
MSALAERIKAWRHALGLTQDEFARRAGIPKRTLVGYENAEREPGSAALAAIAKTGVNMTWLLTGEGEMRVQVPVTPDISASPYARRWEKIMALVEGIEDEEERSAFLDELFARARQTAELAELRQAVKTLTATLKKTA